MKHLMRTSSLMLLATIVTVWVCPHSSHAAGADAPDLFSPVIGAAPAPNPPLAPETIRLRHVNIDLELLRQSRAERRVTLNFMGDRDYTGIIDDVATRTPSRFTTRGRLDGIDGSSFIMVRHDDAVAGVFRFPESPVLYHLRSAGGRIHLISEIDTSLYPPEQMPKSGGDTGPVPAAKEAGPMTPATEDGGVPSAGDACAEPPTVLDIMIVYTPAARTAMGGTHAAAIAQCQLAVEVGQQAYDNSLINPRLRLVHCTEVARTEANDMEDDLDWVTSPFAASAVHADRDTYGADFVHMVVSYGSGIGWCGGGETRAFTVGKWDRIVTTYTLVHEIGHNQGCDHNREDAGGSSCHAQSHSYGHYWTGDSGTQWGSVMSYIGTRPGYFSNPYVNYDGQPTGVPIDEPGEAYNVDQINDIAWYHEDYRTTVYDMWVDFNRVCLFVTCNGAYNTPYGTLADAVAAIPTGENPSELPSLWIKSSDTDETMTISTPMVMRTCNGAATIGE